MRHTRLATTCKRASCCQLWLGCSSCSSTLPCGNSARRCYHWISGPSQSVPFFLTLCLLRMLQALIIFRSAMEDGHFKQQRWEGSGLARAEVNLHAMTAGVAVLSLYCWLLSLQQKVWPPRCSRHPQRLTCHRSDVYLAGSLLVHDECCAVQVRARGAAGLPTRLAVVTDKGKTSREAGQPGGQGGGRRHDEPLGRALQVRLLRLD